MIITCSNITVNTAITLCIRNTYNEPNEGTQYKNIIYEFSQSFQIT